MNYIYGKLSNTLQDLNNIREILLKKCEIANKPINNLKIGDYYLEISFYNTNRISYCDFSQLNNDHKFILNELKKYIELDLANFEAEKEKINKRFNEVDVSIEKVANNLKENVDNILVKISDLDDKIQLEIEYLKNEDLKLNNKLKAEEQRVNNMINQLNENLTVIVDQLNKNISDAINIINAAIQAETQLRTESDEAIIQKINNESEDLNNKIKELNLEFENKYNQLVSEFEAEQNKRAQVDEQLQKNIDNEATERIKKDIDLQHQIDLVNATSGENVKKLIDAINTVSTNLDSEVKRSTNKDTLHDNAIASLNENLANTKAELQKNIDAIDKDLQDKWEQATEEVSATFDEVRAAISEEATARTEVDNDLSQRIENLEGKTTRLYYGTGNQTSPTDTEIQDFIDNQDVEPAYTKPYSGIAIVVYRTDENTMHIWHYYANLNRWQDDGIDTVSTFTNSVRGIIQGTLSEGYISAEGSFGKVNGWETLNSTVSNNYTTLNNKIDSSVSTLNSTISSLSTRLDTKIDTLDNKVDEEITNRTEAINNLDTELTADITAEKTAREQADNTLTTNLSKEVQDRTTAINEEIQNRQNADNIISSRIEQEVADRKAADTNLTNTELRFTKNVGTTVAVGGIAKGTTFSNRKLMDIINEMLYPYVSFSILGFTLSPNGGTYERGSTVSVTNTTTTVALGSEAITSIEILDGGSVLASKTSGFTGNSFAIPISLTVSANKSLTTRVKDDRTTLTRNSASFTFVYPYYYGSLDAGVLDENSIKNLTKIVQQKGNKTFRFTHSNKCCVIAYPASYGNLRTVIDQNNFDITSSFTKNTVSITGLDGTAQNYNVYVNGAATLDNFGITFNY